MKIGAHVSSAGSLDKAIDRAEEIGAEAVQIFVSSPQGWAYKPVPSGAIEAYKSKSKATGISPAFFHGVYLVNLATSNAVNLAKGVDSLTFYMQTAVELGALGVIFHLGSHGGAGFDNVLDQIAASMRHVLDSSLGEPWLVVENSAGMGQHVGSRFAELGRILKEVGSPRVKICLDTQHTFAAGYNVATRDGLQAAMEEFDHEVGLSDLVAVHANDSKIALAGGVDRHENIGEGFIGVEGFENIIGNAVFAQVPFLLEVPGFENTGPDKKNVDTLKSIRKKVLGV